MVEAPPLADLPYRFTPLWGGDIAVDSWDGMVGEV